MHTNRVPHKEKIKQTKYAPKSMNENRKSKRAVKCV